MTDEKITKPNPALQKATTATVISLKTLCTELKIQPRIAREKLRLAAAEPKKHPELSKGRRPRDPWEWPKGSPAEKEARTIIAS